MKLLLQIGIIIGVALALSLLSYVVRPDAIPWRAADFELELKAALDMPDALWVDARTSDDFEAGSYPGAISLAEESWESGFAGLLEVWRPGQPIVVFCASNACLRSRTVADRLQRDLGVDEVYSLKDGWEALVEAGLVRGAGAGKEASR